MQPWVHKIYTPRHCHHPDGKAYLLLRQARHLLLPGEGPKRWAGNQSRSCPFVLLGSCRPIAAAHTLRAGSRSSRAVTPGGLQVALHSLGRRRGINRRLRALGVMRCCQTIILHHFRQPGAAGNFGDLQRSAPARNSHKPNNPVSITTTSSANDALFLHPTVAFRVKAAAASLSPVWAGSSGSACQISSFGIRPGSRHGATPPIPAYSPFPGDDGRKEKVR